jgi:hypothetical protein
MFAGKRGREEEAAGWLAPGWIVGQTGRPLKFFVPDGSCHMQLFFSGLVVAVTDRVVLLPGCFAPSIILLFFLLLPI